MSENRLIISSRPPCQINSAEGSPYQGVDSVTDAFVSVSQAPHGVQDVLAIVKGWGGGVYLSGASTKFNQSLIFMGN